MPKFESSLYEPPFWKKPSRSTLGLMIFILVGVIGYLIATFQGHQVNALVAIGGLGAIGSFYFDIGEKPILGDYIGEIVLTEKDITLNGEKINILEVNGLNISFNTYQNQKIFHRYGYYFLSGTENKISVKTGGKEYNYNFLIYNRNHISDILSVLHFYYKEGLFVNENPGNRTYLGKDLSYEEIQDFKAKYKLEGTGYRKLH